MKVTELESLQIRLASPEEILNWSHGEVLKPETINYRTLKPEKDGLFCERIFGPTTDFQCYCGKYRRIRYKGIVCDRCGVEVTKSAVRRERMGHIKLATPCAHIWFLRGIPSSIGQVLDISREKLERVVYFAAYIITEVNTEAKQKALEGVAKEYKMKVKAQKAKIKNQAELNIVLKKLKEAKDKAINDLNRIQALEVLSELDWQEFSFRYGEVFEAKTGAEALYDIFKKIDLEKEIKAIEAELEKASASVKRKIMRRLRFFQGMKDAGIKPEWMFLTILPVLPPDLRPMVQLDGGRYASSDLNDLYRRVINRNNRLKYLLEIAAPEVIVRNEKRMLQESVDALIDNGMRTATMTRASSGGRRLLRSLADMLKGKKGRFRRNLLGKRVDYSGRSVIVVGPELSLHQVGLPKQMALELFKPFIIKEILSKEFAYNVRGASRLIEQETDEVWAILENVVKGKLVLLNRAPTLHRLGIQAFQPVLIEGRAIELHPLTCGAFNADFDGDQMAVHLPLSEEAQTEAREIMLSSLNLLKPATGRPVVSPSQDIILGAYLLSRIKDGAKGEGRAFSSSEEAVMAYELQEIELGAKIKVLGPLKGKIGKPELLETSVGRIIFNRVLPDDFEFYNELLDSKKLERISWLVIEKYGAKGAPSILDKIKELGFYYSTQSGLSLSIADFIVPPGKKEIVKKAEQEAEKIRSLFRQGFLSEQEKSEKVVEIWTQAKKEIGKLLPQTLPQDGPVFTIADSGCRGSWVQPIQIAGMKGLVVNPSGEVIELPVKNSYKEGLGVLEYFISTHGARKGTADTALGTSKAGYLTRRLVDVAHELMVIEPDCGDKKGSELYLQDATELGQGFGFKIVGRVSLEEIKDKQGEVIVKKGEIINWAQAEKIAQNEIAKVKVRSPLSCQSLGGVCQQCYGWDLGRDEVVRLGEAVGVVAAQAIGEPGTQLTLRTFHTGGVAGGGDITVGLPRVDEVFEARIPKGEAIMALADGEVLAIKERAIQVKNIVDKDTKDKKVISAGRDKKAKTKKEETVTYRLLEGLSVLVKVGDKIKAGQPLCEGSLRLQTLFKLTDKANVQRYIVQEVQRIYVSQGVRIHDKHIEVVARQMFSRVRVRSVGESDFSPGQVIEASKFFQVNEALKAKKKKLVTGKEVVLGISRVALTTDSFLSAASFQHTSRILIEAALRGQEDHLRGLKENVIIGKLIPAGTGFKKNKK